jgi:hypothetical protein
MVKMGKKGGLERGMGKKGGLERGKYLVSKFGLIGMTEGGRKRGRGSFFVSYASRNW